MNTLEEKKILCRYISFDPSSEPLGTQGDKLSHCEAPSYWISFPFEFQRNPVVAVLSVQILLPTCGGCVIFSLGKRNSAFRFNSETFQWCSKFAGFSNGRFLLYVTVL